MYRPNRIGPWPIIDPDGSAVAWPTAWNSAGNFNSVDSAKTAREPHFYTATVQTEHDELYWQADTNMQLALDQCMTFGIAIDGTHETEEPIHLSGHVYVSGQFDSDVSDMCNAEIGVGRLDAASVDVTRTGSNNNLDRFIALSPTSSVWTLGAFMLSWSGSVIIADRAADGFDTAPLVFYASLINNGGGPGTLGDLRVAMSIHRYVSDLRTWEPTR